jgi:twinkle protein
MPAALHDDPKFEGVLQYLTGSEEGQRYLSENVVRKYGVGAHMYSFLQDDGNWYEQPCITFPWLHDLPDDGGWLITRIKARALANKAHQRLTPAGGMWGLFGWHTVPHAADTIVITEGEFDAMSVHQATGMPAVSLPNGCRSLPVELLPWLERFVKIYLWMDNDVAGQEGAEAFAKKLGAGRVLIVPGVTKAGEACKDANDGLKRGLDLGEIIDGAKVLPHKQIVTFDEVREEIYRELANPQQVAGVQSSSLPGLNSLLKGHRKGELTILTGPTGVGKTTLLTQLSLDFCEQGVNTLWGSFEIKLTRLCKTMMKQHAGRSLEVSVTCV